MVGLGAGGGAAAYTLSFIKGLHGSLSIIDPDEIELSNLNRYIYAIKSDADSNVSKVGCIANLFNGINGLSIKALYEPYIMARKRLVARDFELLAAAVDNRRTRREIQFDTPQTIIDAAATSQGDFFIWNMMLGRTECMFCKHPHNQKDAELIQARQLSKLLGLDSKSWLRMIENNDKFAEKQLNEIVVKTKGLDLKIDFPHIGQRFQSWFNMNCGRLKLPEIDGEIPIPFAPVMAGVLQAGEILKCQLFPEYALKGYYWNSLTARLNPLIKPSIKAPKKGCYFCNDTLFLNQYYRMWFPRLELKSIS